MTVGNILKKCYLNGMTQSNALCDLFSNGPISYRVLHNYVIWRLVMDLMPHLPSKYQKTRAKFRSVLLGILIDR